MTFWSSFLDVVGTVVAAVVRSVIGLFTKPKDPSPPAPAPIQPLLLVLPSTVLIRPVFLNDELRDLLRMKGTAPSDRPKLYIPGPGIVRVDAFVDAARDELLFKADDYYTCARCAEARRAGAYFANRWFCSKCFPDFLRDLATGASSIPFSPETVTARSWSDLGATWDSTVLGPLSTDPLLRQLGLLPDPRQPRRLTPGALVRELSGAENSVQYFVISVPLGASRLVVETNWGTGDSDLYLNHGTLPTTNVYETRSYSSTTVDRVSIERPAAGDWYILLHGWRPFQGVQLTANYERGLGAA